MTAGLRISFWFACILVAVLSLFPANILDARVFDWWDKARHVVAFLFLGAL